MSGHSKKGKSATRRKATNANGSSSVTLPISTKDYVLRSSFAALQILVLLPCISLATLASQISLDPLYGSATATQFFPHVIIASCVLSMLRPSMPAHRTLFFLALILSVAPYTAKWFGAYTARWRDPVWGPVVVQLGLAIPIVGLSGVLVRNRLGYAVPGLAENITTPLSSLIVYGGVRFLEPLWWDWFTFGGEFTSCNMFLGLGVLSALFSALSSDIKGNTPSEASRSLLLTGVSLSIPLLLAVFTKSQSPCSVPNLPVTYQAGNATVKLLAKSESVTGTIVVGENLLDGYRYLRADHSLLGGLWIGRRAPHGKEMGDSIYTAFVLQDVIRLIEREVPENYTQNALIIGLGAGIAAQSFIDSKFKTTVVEIDPAVYNYARNFFGLSEPHEVYITDARSWVHYESNASFRPKLGPKFNLVVHDCFSGGGVPAHIFTSEFWTELKTVMAGKGEGESALAVNFAGHLGSNAARAIWFTLQKNFGNSCRVFHDLIGQEEEKPLKPDEFVNMVFFCRPDGKKITFRSSTEKDYHDSWLRQYVFKDFDKREVGQRQLIGLMDWEQDMEEYVDGDEWILTDENNKLGVWQRKTAIEHWSIMRGVMPDIVWETY